MKKTQLTAYYKKDNSELVCEIAPIYYGGNVVWLLRGLGFEQVKGVCGIIPGRFRLFAKSENQLDKVFKITEDALNFINCAVETSFSI